MCTEQHVSGLSCAEIEKLVFLVEEYVNMKACSVGQYLHYA